VNCHVMNEQYDAWTKSGHRHAATCVGCHLPHEGLAKWMAKAEHGFRHSVAFTLQNFKEPIEITSRDRLLVQVNCVRCHEGLVHAVVVGGGPTRDEVDCLRCHAGAGH
jgi:cytochrome c nitrite reductase small subunit